MQLIFFTFSLMENLIEHLNAEICSESIYDLSSAMKWLKSTFFYIRARKNPKQYKIPDGTQDIDIYLKSNKCSELISKRNLGQLHKEPRKYGNDRNVCCKWREGF